MRLQRLIVNERQFDRPIMRQVENAPFRVVEGGLRESELAGLREISLVATEAEVSAWVCAMALEELPIEVEQKAFARRDGGLGFSGQQRLPRMGYEAQSRNRDAGTEQVTTSEG